MRGKLGVYATCVYVLRITPADAGKTLILFAVGAALKDHPRGCGENISSVFVFPDFIGSPPRMRGKPMQNTLRNAAIRITPADAGKTRIQNGRKSVR